MKRILPLFLMLLCLCGCSKSSVNDLYIRTRYKGEEVIFSIKENEGINNYAMLFEDGYVGKLERGNADEQAMVAFMDDTGKIKKVLNIKGDRYCFITDMAELGGKLFVSVYSVPKGLSDNLDVYSGYETSRIEEYLEDEEQLFQVVKENYNSELYVLQSGEFKKISIQENSLNGRLSVENNKLCWSVDKILSVKRAEAVVSSYLLNGKSEEYSYIFDENCNLEKTVKSDTVTDFTI